MYSAVVAVAALLVFHGTDASTSYPEQNPALQEYQNESPCFPLEETWYVVYRNYETDPYFGGSAKCVRFSETDPGENGAYPVILEYKPSFSAFDGFHSSDLTVTLSSSPGYTLKIILNFQPQGQNTSVLAYTAYKDVKKCDVLRTTYAGEKACSLLVPKSQLGHHEVCCDFIFDLLCGTTPKFNISDSSCP